MQELVIRKIPFDFDGVPFLWNPDNPRFALDMNKVSFFAIGLERYFCRAVQAAEPRIDDPQVLAIARAFREQESLHSLAHRQHVRALSARYPGLRETLEQLIAHFDALYEARSLDFHLAYAGGLESIFTPVFRLFLDYRAIYFGGGDPRVASLFLWHFCEEIEHRSAALDVYNHVCGSYLFRLRNLPAIARHVAQGLQLLDAGFKAHVPDVPAHLYSAPEKVGVPRGAHLAVLSGILGAQLPGHRPAKQSVPEYFHEWTARHAAGEDMTRVYGQGVGA
ncbi:metal-dependent hydrolase [Mangrovimicrobium sediminis]|nr:metal-dependent hydrolase [Haliea sp. SAOS-164]